MITRHTQRTVTWIDCVSPTPAEVRQLMYEFGIDPALAEELLLPSFKPRVERRSDLLFVILHFPVLRTAHQHPEQEIDFLIGKDFLITVRYEQIDPLHAFAKAFAVEEVLGTNAATAHGGHLFVAMVRNVYQALGDECDTIRRRLRDIEEHIFSGEERTMVAHLSQTGRIIHDFRQSLVSHDEMLASLEPAGIRLFGQEFSYHMRILIGSYQRIERTLENLYGSLAELRETNNSLLSTKQNETMKNLTIMAFVTFPLTLISSIFGMNTKYLPIVGMPGDFWIIIGAMAVIACSLFLFFRHKHWI